MAKLDIHRLRRFVVWEAAIGLAQSMYDNPIVLSVSYKAHPDEFQMRVLLAQNDADTLRDVTTTFRCMAAALAAVEKAGLLTDVFPMALSLEARVAPQQTADAGNDSTISLALRSDLIADPPRGRGHDREMEAQNWELIKSPHHSKAPR